MGRRCHSSDRGRTRSGPDGESISTARELGLECLVEVHDPVELDKLDLDSVDLLGVNNRNLKTFDVDIGRTAAVRDLVPSNVTVISESGLRSAPEILKLKGRGVDGFLIGTAFMKARSPGAALSALLTELNTTMQSPRKLRMVAV